MHDLVITNARICDGLGSALRPGSLGVKDGRISALGEDVGSGRESFDAGGLVLAPGIVDTHTHYDAQITWDPSLNPSPALGVTTVVMGNCGFAIAPCRAADRDLTMRNLVRVEGMSLDAMHAGIQWRFESFPEYMDMIAESGVVPNLAAFVGHSAVRTYVLGDDAPRRQATVDEIAQMCAIVREAMDAGAIGFATSTSPSHNGASGEPMPSRLANDEELRALVGVLGEAERGIFMLTKGGGTSIPFLESLAAETSRPVMIAALLHNSTNPDGVFQELDQIRDARERGHKLYGQVSCCPLTMEFTLAAPYPLEGIAAWSPALTAAPGDLPGILADTGFRDSVEGDLSEPAPVRLFNGEWHKLRVLEVVKPENRCFEGHDVAELAAAEGKRPLDWMLDLALEENLRTTFVAVLLNSDDSAVAKLLTHPASAIALSDAGAHLSFFCDAGFGLHLLGYWVRERQVMSLEEGVRRLTSEPADIYGIRDRGRLSVGAHADLLLFDPQRVARGSSRRVFDLPAGAPRLTSDAIGVHGVWVNGTRVVDDNGVSSDGAGPGQRPGQLLREFAS
ncbi:MAG: amidohydrolase family protein [Gammaproteobacteria bacterium]|jgi:N-acyl-D-aspartate/D-glutamate deacylase|nr:amidohydrolase family protein [Gammaproteobacteria bacterium]